MVTPLKNRPPKGYASSDGLQKLATVPKIVCRIVKSNKTTPNTEQDLGGVIIF